MGVLRDVSGRFGVSRGVSGRRYSVSRDVPGALGAPAYLAASFSVRSAVSVRKPPENTSVLLEETRK